MTISEQIASMFDQLHAGILLPGVAFSTVNVTVRKQSSGTYSAVTRDIVRVPTDISTTALYGLYSAKEIADSGGLIVKGDARFKFLKSVVGVLDTNTIIILGTQEFRVIDINSGYLNGVEYDLEVQARAWHLV